MHVAVSVDREARLATLLLNGKEVSSQGPRRDSDLNLMENDHAVYDIGLKRDDGSANFKGFVKDLVIFRRALQQAEVDAIKGA